MIEIRKYAYRSMLFIIAAVFLIGLEACQQQTKTSEKQDEALPVSYDAPEWSKDAVIYEVNLRQYTPEGTLKAFESHLPRLKNLGVDILWIMPIHPISLKNRKGSLGSYYAVQDYKAVNPEFGTLDDFKSFVSTAHEMGFYVILDWVANHTGWDNPWITDHPGWYTRDSLGDMIAPSGWTDVAELDYENDSLWEAMTDALKFWVEEADVDGYRCDVATDVPTPFWEYARHELEKVKPMFMLAEAELPEHHHLAFDMSYAWELHSIFNKIAKGEKNANDLEAYFVKNDSLYPPDAYRMAFITNHDENSWNGTVAERMGPSASAFAVLSYTLPGMPLIYSGQEVGNTKALEFFEKDEITWDLTAPEVPFYTTLNRVKKANEALWNGTWGGELARISTNADEQVFAFHRVKNGNAVLVVVNLSETPQAVELVAGEYAAEYVDGFSGQPVSILQNASFKLDAWAYRIYVRNAE